MLVRGFERIAEPSLLGYSLPFGFPALLAKS